MAKQITKVTGQQEDQLLLGFTEKLLQLTGYAGDDPQAKPHISIEAGEGMEKDRIAVRFLREEGGMGTAPVSFAASLEAMKWKGGNPLRAERKGDTVYLNAPPESQDWKAATMAMLKPLGERAAREYFSTQESGSREISFYRDYKQENLAIFERIALLAPYMDQKILQGIGNRLSQPTNGERTNNPHFRQDVRHAVEMAPIGIPTRSAF